MILKYHQDINIIALIEIKRYQKSETICPLWFQRNYFKELFHLYDI